jgi:hypothetical protein
VEAVVKLFLKRPGKLGVLDFARAEQESVVVDVGVFGLVADLDFDAFFRGTRGEVEEGMFVADDFCLNLFEQVLGHGAGLHFRFEFGADALECRERFRVEKDEIYFLERRGTFEMLGSFA